MLRLVWTEPALDDLDHILDYIAADSSKAAASLKDQIDRAILVALEYPYGFRRGRLEGTREIVAHPNYIVIYRVYEDHLRILSILHARQEYP